MYFYVQFTAKYISTYILRSSYFNLISPTTREMKKKNVMCLLKHAAWFMYENIHKKDALVVNENSCPCVIWFMSVYIYNSSLIINVSLAVQKSRGLN